VASEAESADTAKLIALCGARLAAALIRWRYAATIAFALAMALPGIAALPPLDRDEARFAQASAQMLETGDFIAIRFQERERNKKPAGIYWLQAASVAAVSDVGAREIWASRLPSAFGAAASAALTVWIGGLLFGPAAGLTAGVLLAASLGLAGEATIAKTDAVLLASVLAGQGALAKLYLQSRNPGRTDWRWAAGFWLAIGISGLIKGPIGPGVAALTVGALCLADRSPALLRALRPARGAVLAAAVVAPWAIAIWAATEGRFFTEALGGDMLAKLGGAQESHGAPPGYYAALVWITFWPATLALPVAVARAWRDRGAPASAFLIAWAAPAWIAFEAASTKLPHYVLPLYPALALLAARAALAPGGAAAPVLERVGAAVFLATAAALTGLMVAGPHLYAPAGAGPGDLAIAGAGLAAAMAIAIAAWRGRLLGACLAACGLSLAASALLQHHTLPKLEALQVSPRLVAELRQAGGCAPCGPARTPLAVSGYSEPSLVFLAGTGTRLTTPAGVAEHLAGGPQRFGAVEARGAEEFASALRALGGEAEALATVRGLNYSRGDVVALTLYRSRVGDAER